MNLDELRGEIDRIDADIVRLLNERMKVAVRIGRIKKKAGVPIHVPEREKEVYARVVGANEGPLLDSNLRDIYRKIMSVTRSVESGLTVKSKAGRASR